MRKISGITFHLYHYAGNNPIRYTDPDGNIQTPVEETYIMQDSKYGKKTIKGSGGDLIKNAGCAITFVSNLTQDFAGKALNPEEVNEQFVNDGLINWDEVGNYLDIKVEKIDKQFNREQYLNQSDSKTLNYRTAVNVNYNSKKGDHWVGVEAMASIENKDYVIISRTSINDNNMDKKNRGGQGWIYNDKYIFVPVEQTKGFVNFISE